MPRFTASFAAALLLSASVAAAQTQPTQTQGEPGANTPGTQQQANPGAAKQAQPDGDEIGWGQNKTDNESKSETGRNEITGPAPASAPPKAQ